MCPAHLATVAGVIHNERTFFDAVVDGLIHFGIALPAGSSLLGVGIKINLVGVVLRIIILDKFSQIVGLVGVQVAFFVVADKCYHIAPVVHTLAAGSVVYHFVNTFFRLFGRCYHKASDANVDQIFFVHTFVGIEKSKIVVGGKRGDIGERIRRFVSRDKVGVVLHPVFEVVGSIAKKQQIARHHFTIFGTGIKHAHHLFDGGNILRSRRKFVVNCLRRSNQHRQVRKVAMEICQTVGLIHKVGM